MQQTLSSDGSLKDNVVTATKLTTSLQASLTKADEAIPAIQKGAVNGVASLDGSTRLPAAQLPTSAITKSSNSGDTGKAIDAYTGLPLVVGGVTITHRGAWNASAAYVVGDIVTIATGSFICVVSGTSATSPDADATNWGLIATNGADLTATTAVPIYAKSATYTLALAERGGLHAVSSSSAVVITVPTNASVAIPVGSIYEIARRGTGAVTFSEASGVTIPLTTFRTIARQGSHVSLMKVATDEWDLVGDLA